MTQLTLPQIQEKYIPPLSWLPKEFQYPERFLEYILFDKCELEVNDVMSSIAFLWKDEVIQWGKFLRKAGYPDLIPFGSADDDLFCFDKQDSNRIYLVDLSEKPTQEHELTQFKNFYEFINAIRIGNGLEHWRP